MLSHRHHTRSSNASAAGALSRPIISKNVLLTSPTMSTTPATEAREKGNKAFGKGQFVEVLTVYRSFPLLLPPFVHGSAGKAFQTPFE